MTSSKETTPPRTEQTSLVLNPDQLLEYSRVNPDLPALIVKARNDELQRQFLYAVLSLLSGLAGLFALIAGFVFLALHGHPQAAAGLLATGVLGLIGGFVRSRL